MIYFDIYEKIIKAIIFCLRQELKENGQKKLTHLFHLYEPMLKMSIILELLKI